MNYEEYKRRLKTTNYKEVEGNYRIPYIMPGWKNRYGLRLNLFSMTPRFYVRNPRKFIHDVWHHNKDQIKAFIQRGLYGYSFYEFWGTDEFLSVIMPDLIRKQKFSHTWPGEYALSEDGEDGKTEEEGRAEWLSMLEDMALAFEIMRDDIDPSDFYNKPREHVEALHKQQWDAFFENKDGIYNVPVGTRLPNIEEFDGELVFDHDAYMQAIKDREQDRLEKMALFAKWLQALWD